MRRPSLNRHALAIATLVAAAAALVAPISAHAAPPELEASEVEGCPSSAELRRSIETQLGRDVDFESASAPRISVRVRRTTSGALAADVTLATPTAAPTTRTIEGPSCPDLLRAAALTIALALEADAAPAPAPAPTPTPTPAPAPAPAPDRDALSPAPTHALRADRAVILASAITSLGLLPTASAGGAASARVRITDAVWLSARGLYLPEARMPNDAFGMTLLAGGAGACVEPIGSHSITAVGCAHAVGGSLAVAHADVPMRNGGAKPFGAAVLSAGARARVVGPLTVEGAVEAAVPFAHPTYLTETCPSTGFQQPFAALALVLGAGVSIP